MSDIIGDLIVQITGDYSSLVEDIGQAASVAADGATKITDSFNSAAASSSTFSDSTDSLAESVRNAAKELGLSAEQATSFSSLLQGMVSAGDSTSEAIARIAESAATVPPALISIAEAMQSLQTASSGAGDTAQDAAQQLELFSKSEMDSVASSKDLASAMQSIPFADANGQLNLFSTAVSTVPPKIEETAQQTLNWKEALSSLNQPLSDATYGSDTLVTSLLQFAGITLTLNGLKDAIENSFEAFARVERATEALTALTGSSDIAEASISKLRTLAMDDALSFPSLLKADQAFEALQVPTEEIPGLLNLAADAARATNKEFDTTAQMLERVVAQGTVGVRQLQTLGLTTQQLADVMEVSTPKVSSLFKALDQQDRIDVITSALQKFSGMAAQTADDLTGSWQKLKNQAEFTFEGIGEALAPAATQFIQFAGEEVRMAGSVVSSIASIGSSFEDLSQSVTNALIAIAVAVGANPLAALGLEIIQLGLQWKGLQDAEVDLARVTKEADDSFAAIAVTEHQMFSAFPDYTAKFNALLAQMNSGEITHEQYQQKVRDLNTEFHNLNPVVEQATAAHSGLMDQVAKLNAQLSSGAITQTQFNTKLKELIDAANGATKATKDHVLSLDDLITKNTQLNSQLGLAQSVYDQVTARVRAGSGEYNLQSEALKQLTAAHKALGDAETSVDIIVAVAEAKNADLTDKITAQYQAVQQLTDKYGANNEITIQADTSFANLAKQVGLTKTQFADLVAESDDTGVSLLDLVNDAGSVAKAFQEMGITSSAQMKQMADDNRNAYNQIVTDVNSSLGDIYAAKQKDLEVDQKERDSLSGLGQAFKDLGITSSQSIMDSIDKMSMAYDHIRDVGTSSFGDLQRASDALRQKHYDLQQSLSGLEDDFRALGLTSSAQLKHIADEAEIMYNRISGSGQASAGDIQRAHDAMVKANEKYQESLAATDGAHVNVGRSSGVMAQQVVSSFGLMMLSITNTNAAMHDIGMITVQDISSVQGLADIFGSVTSAIGTATVAMGQLDSQIEIGSQDAGTLAQQMAAVSPGAGSSLSIGGNPFMGMTAAQIAVAVSHMPTSSNPAYNEELQKRYSDWIQQALGSIGGVGGPSTTPGVGVTMTPKATGGGAPSSSSPISPLQMTGGSSVPTPSSSASSGGVTPEMAAFMAAIGIPADQIAGAVMLGQGQAVPTIQQKQISDTGSGSSINLGGMGLPPGSSQYLSTSYNEGGPSSPVNMASTGQGFTGSIAGLGLSPGSSQYLSTSYVEGGPAKQVSMADLGTPTVSNVASASPFTFPTIPAGGLTEAQSLAQSYASVGATMPTASTPYVSPPQDYSQMQWFGGMGPTAAIAAAAVAALPTVVASVATTNIPTDIAKVASTAPAISQASSAPMVTITTPVCNINVAGGAAGSSGVAPTINMYVTVANQSMADSLVASIQNLGVTTGKV